METIIKTQEELDKIDLDFRGYIIITGGNLVKPINLSKYYPNAYVILKENAVINMYDNSYVKEMKDNSCVNSMRDNSCVDYMWDDSCVNGMNDNSCVNNMKDNSCVIQMFENSCVNWMWGNSCVYVMFNNSYVKEMKGNSSVNRMRDYSCVYYMNDNSFVKNMYDNAKVTVYNKNVKVNCLGNNIVFVSKEINELSNIKVNDSSQIIHDTFDTNQSVDFYLKKYNIKKKDDNTLIMYKAVHKSKVDGEYFSNFNKNFIYKIGQTMEHECSKDINNLCSIGLHVSDLAFAKRFGRDWEDLSIIECEVPISDIVISKDCDGKVRTSKLTVIKEIN